MPIECSGQWHRFDRTPFALPTGSAFAFDRIFSSFVEACLRAWHVTRVRYIRTPIVGQTSVVRWMIFERVRALALTMSPRIHAECWWTALNTPTPVVQIIATFFDIGLECPFHVWGRRAIEKIQYLTVEANIHDAAIVEISRDDFVHRLEETSVWRKKKRRKTFSYHLPNRFEHRHSTECWGNVSRSICHSWYSIGTILHRPHGGITVGHIDRDRPCANVHHSRRRVSIQSVVCQTSNRIELVNGQISVLRTWRYHRCGNRSASRYYQRSPESGTWFEISRFEKNRWDHCQACADDGKWRTRLDRLSRFACRR